MKKLITFILIIAISTIFLTACGNNQEQTEQMATITAQKIVQAQQQAKIQEKIFEQEKAERLQRKRLIEKIVLLNNNFLEYFPLCDTNKQKGKIVRIMRDQLTPVVEANIYKISPLCEKIYTLTIRWHNDILLEDIAPDKAVGGDAGLIKGIENINKELNNIINKELVSEINKFYEMYPELVK